jgi:hypothetical protein
MGRERRIGDGLLGCGVLDCDACTVRVDQPSICPEDGGSRFLHTTVNCYQNQGFTFQKVAAVILTAVRTSNYS